MNKHLLSFACGLVAALLPAQDSKPDAARLRSAAEAAIAGQDWDAAVAGYRKLTELDAKDEDAWFKLGYSLHGAKKLDEALPIHMKAAAFPRYAAVASYNVACVYSLKGDKDQAFEWLDKAVAAGWDRVEAMDGDPDMDPIRKDARYEKVLAKMKSGAARGASRIQVYVPPAAERKSVRIALFGQGSSPGQVALDFGPVKWNEAYAGKINAPEFQAKKWRFGKDFWTTLDTSIDLELAGTAVPAGYYYLTLEKRGEDFILALHDAAATRKLKLDGAVAHMLKGGIEVKLQHSTGEVANELDIALRMEKDSMDTGGLVVRFGPHVLNAPLRLKLQ